MSHEPWLLVGLGNPGLRYAKTRHNIGYQLLDRWAETHSGFSFREMSRFNGEIAVGRWNAPDSATGVILLKPHTFMNRSGESVSSVIRYYDLDNNHIIVVHDDVDLERGRLKIKQGGGDGGHKGIRSILDHLIDHPGDDAFIRIRLGVGRPENPRVDIADFVLSPFASTEAESINILLERAIGAIELILNEGVRTAMNTYNVREFASP